MVTLLLDSTQLEVVLSPIERTLSRRTTSVRIAREHIVKVQLTDDAWTWLRIEVDRINGVARRPGSKAVAEVAPAKARVPQLKRKSA